MLVATTALIFATGVWLLLLGHHSDLVLTLHKVSFIVWSGVFGVHFLAYLPRVGRSLGAAWGSPAAGGPRGLVAQRGARRSLARRRRRARARAALAHHRLARRAPLLTRRD